MSVGGSPSSARELTLGGLSRSQALHCRQALAIADGMMQISYLELDVRTNRLAHALANLRVGHGDRVAALLLEGLPVIELLLACGKLGAILVPLNWRLAAEEIAHILDSVTPRMLFYSATFSDLVGQRQPGLTTFVVPDVASLAGDYENLVASGAATAPWPTVRGGDPLYMIHTSGTTGKPKGCLQCHDGTVIAALAMAARLQLTRDDRLISTAPLFHVGGLSHVFSALAAGAGIVIAPRRPGADALLRLICDRGCTFGSLSDSLLQQLVSAQQKTPLPLRLRLITRGSGLTPVAQIQSVRAALRADVVGGYGQSEIGGFALMIDGPEMVNDPTALGTPLPHVECAILGGDGLPDPQSNIGELGLRGPSVMAGYWSDPDASHQALGSGWLRTGDLVRRNGHDRLHFVGRSKELVKTGGENVYPREVELVLLEHPAVADAAIIGVPHARWGETVKACVVLRSGATLAPSEISEWCRRSIAAYKRPRYVEFVAEIPRDQLGKIQRSLLRQRPITPSQATE